MDNSINCRGLSRETVNRKNKVHGIKPFPTADGYALAKGDKSDLCFIVSMILNTLSIYYDFPHVPVCAVLGDEAEQCIKEFQRANLLDVTGKLDLDTWNRMSEEYDLAVNENQ